MKDRVSRLVSNPAPCIARSEYYDWRIAGIGNVPVAEPLRQISVERFALSGVEQREGIPLAVWQCSAFRDRRGVAVRMAAFPAGVLSPLRRRAFARHASER